MATKLHLGDYGVGDVPVFVHRLIPRCRGELEQVDAVTTVALPPATTVRVARDCHVELGTVATMSSQMSWSDMTSLSRPLGAVTTRPTGGAP